MVDLIKIAVSFLAFGVTVWGISFGASFLWSLFTDIAD